MKLVGKAMRSKRAGKVVIGIFSWGVTNGRENMGATESKPVRGETVPYAAERASGNGAPLNPDHTHFLLVDNGKRGGAAFGGEIKVRAALEKYVSQVKRVPIVMLVVQGGPGTLSTVRYYGSPARTNAWLAVLERHLIGDRAARHCGRSACTLTHTG